MAPSTCQRALVKPRPRTRSSPDPPWPRAETKIRLFSNWWFGFEHWNKEALDLHTLFEAGGNDPEARTRVFDIIERLVKEGLLEELGNDFYSLTEKGTKRMMNDE